MERAGIPGVTVHTLETLISEIDDERRRLRNRLEELDKVERAACGLTI